MILDGYIEPRELRVGFRKAGFTLTDQEVDLIFKYFDSNANGKLEYSEFISAMNVGQANGRYLPARRE